MITVKGLEAVRRADVIVFDRLVAPELVAEAPEGAERIFAGKRAGAHADQGEINVLLVARAFAGKTVVRLKGGDPFVFGRGGEEASALAAFGVPFEVVPGISAAIAAPAYAGIPVTHRGVASGFAVVTAHQCDGAHPVDWAAIAAFPGTLVLMMGVRGLAIATKALIAAGRPADQPAAVIENGTTPEQRTVAGTLSTIADVAGNAGIKPPATAVLGEVASLADQLAWYEGEMTPIKPAVRTWSITAS